MEKRKIFVIALIVFATLGSSFIFYFYQMFTGPNILVSKQPQTVFIPANSTFRDVQNIMYDQDVVQDMVSFSFVSKILKYQDNIKPGRYVFEPNMNNVEAVRKLRAGDQDPLTVTFNNVRTSLDLAEKITANIELETEEFLKVLHDSTLFSSFGFNHENKMAMYIPNTYEVYWTIDADELIKKLHSQYKSFWNEDRKSKAAEIGMTPVEISILASIVQAESKVFEEQPTIAGVYINRLKRGIPLQADPTVVFAVGDFEIKRVLNEHLEIDSPYNTYKYAGLPPGPINLPEARVIDAVLNFEKHSYLYFCAKEDFSGSHNFAKTLSEHNINAAKYQRALSRAKIFK
ncbi:endolytic transglycosylase MltG [Aureibacter tunicatorum]|uniref:Endolytic murein transglycosylase n=1 Tax=Aureibacter tunicatorum TaxID=866807 RepID=A0AAE3XIT9_9BACT|nr:endolytic transglycosylase MltG [Aureibacter tunicatorum]MDR6237187.1 UPF0755 protein [Aureibacter tunicatorum]BDD06179.1 aminodeoxychorismate lyase [Aureibacter tunicatorum]